VNPRNDALAEFLYTQLWRRVAAAIDDLPAQEKLIMTLYYFEELDLSQIGTAMGVSLTCASQIYASGVLNLRARLGDYRRTKPLGNVES
jgi:RNA polymerase sigma factor for flagellar operon FliA